MARILVVDDDADMRGVVVTVLALAGHDVVEAGHGGEALARLALGPVDLLVTDRSMPVLDGLELVRRLRARAVTAAGGGALPVLLVSAHDGRADVARAFAAGADDFLAKPFPIAVLQQRVADLLAVPRRQECEQRQEVARPLGT